MAIGKYIQTFTAACWNVHIYQTSWRHISQAVFSHPRENLKSQLDSDGWNGSFTICSHRIISYSMFPSFFVFCCFPSLLSSHIHPFIVAEHWLGSSPSWATPLPPLQEETFFILFSVSQAYYRKDFLTPDHLVTKPRSLASLDIFILRWLIYGFNFRPEACVTSDLYFVGVVFHRKT